MFLTKLVPIFYFYKFYNQETMPYNQNERILMVAKENALQAVLTAAQTIFSTFFCSY